MSDLFDLVGNFITNLFTQTASVISTVISDDNIIFGIFVVGIPLLSVVLSLIRKFVRRKKV